MGTSGPTLFARPKSNNVNQSSLSLPSFAKINWSLQILGKRTDGYHEVRTLLQTISLNDDLHFEVTEDSEITLSCDQPGIPTDDRNLVVRAANALKDRYKVKLGTRIQLHKQIPAKAGLGGASSNAAISLMALARLWDVPADNQALLEIARTLGADVPFFLLGGCALATGIGATLSPLPDGEPQHLVVVTPRAEVSTANAYAALSTTALTSINTDPILFGSLREANSLDSTPWALRDDLKNDFEPVIFDIEPETRKTKEALLQAGARTALLAGSGSSVFGIFSDRGAQQRALNVIQSAAGWRIFPCVTVSRTEYVRTLGKEGISF
jgi:4-diphosphocytidyl-2-C-methyl-D-erythritol kinase